MNLAEIGGILWRGILDPASAAKKILGLGLSVKFMINAALIVSIAGILLSYLSVALTSLMYLPDGAPESAMGIILLDQPILGAAAQMAVMVLAGWGLGTIGPRMGGRGGFAESFAVIVAVNAMMLVLSAVQFLLMFALPFAGLIFGFAAMVWALWATVLMVKEAQGFATIGQSITLCLIVFMLIVAVMTVVLVMMWG